MITMKPSTIIKITGLVVGVGFSVAAVVQEAKESNATIVETVTKTTKDIMNGSKINTNA